MITILAVGKKHDSWLEDGVIRYQKRLIKPWEASWQLLSHSNHAGDQARNDESERLLSKIKPDDFIVLLDERGKSMDSPTLSRALLTPLEQSKRMVIIIGGAYGVNAEVFERANIVWSLSRLVFPHQLVRLILVEQLYRSQEIALNHPYHHE